MEPGDLILPPDWKLAQRAERFFIKRFTKHNWNTMAASEIVARSKEGQQFSQASLSYAQIWVNPM